MAKITGAQDWIQVLAWSDDIVTLLVGSMHSEGYAARIDLTNAGAAELVAALGDAIESNEEGAQEYDEEDSVAIDLLTEEVDSELEQ